MILGLDINQKGSSESQILRLSNNKGLDRQIGVNIKNVANLGIHKSISITHDIFKILEPCLEGFSKMHAFKNIQECLLTPVVNPVYLNKVYFIKQQD